MTFFVLQITSRIAKKSTTTIRMVLASALGGLYSFVILLDELPIFIVSLSKLLSAAVIILVAFSHYRIKSFAICLGIFFFSSMVILGVVVGLYIVLENNNVAINNSAIYFNISAKNLVLAGFFAYMISTVVVRIYNRVLSSKELYTMIVENNGQRAVMLAMIDTGNHLREPFSNLPVIVVNENIVKHLIGESALRYVPASTVSGNKLLPAFKPKRIIIKTSKGSEVIENAYIALSQDVNSNSFSAILNPEILSV